MVTAAEIERAAQIIRGGGLVAFPTETVYGLGANALDERAVERVYEAKGRPPASPLIVHVDSTEMAKGVVREWPDIAGELAARFWPGPLTLVLPKRMSVPDRVTAGLGTVGVRIPAHPIALNLVRAAGVPIAAPSANRFTQLSPTTAEHVRQSLGSAVDLILDGGPAAVGIESTVLSLATDRPLLLRPGMITREQLESVIGHIVTHGAEEGRPHPSPGMHEKHYSPRTPLYVGDYPKQGRGVYLWWKHPMAAASDRRLSREPRECAAQLYALLHRLDAEGWDFIAIEEPPDGVEWEAIADRIRRAGGRGD